MRRARNVALATGYYDHPNRLGIPGEDLPHVAHYYDEPHPFYRKPVVVVGGKNSAAIAALELCRAGAKVTLVHRREALADSIKYWIRPDIENRIKEGAVTARLATRVIEIRRDHVVVEGPAGRGEIPAEAVFLLTGYHPDADLFRRAGDQGRRRDAQAGARSADARIERPRALPRGLSRLGPRDQPHLHRERALSRGDDREGGGRQEARGMTRLH